MSGTRRPWTGLGDLPTRGVSELIARLTESFLGRCLRRFVNMSGFDRCIVLSSQAFTALIPLLILMSTLAPAGQSNSAANLIVRKFDLTGDAAASVHQLFATPSGAATSSCRARSSTTLSTTRSASATSRPTSSRRRRRTSAPSWATASTP